MKRPLIVVVLLLSVLGVGTAMAAQYVPSPPLSQVLTTPVGAVKSSAEWSVPIITWGADIATIQANGGTPVTDAASIFAQKQLRVRLVRQDDFKKQVEAYLKGDTPFLRGTMGMVNLASEVLNRDPRTKPVVVYQLSWSNGGDYLVVKEGIHAVSDLKGKTIALQAYGPHVDYLTTLLKDAGLAVKDVKIKWTRDLTGTEETPAEAFLADREVDAAFAITPDALKLTSGGKVGTGAEGSVKGARVLLSTKTANRIIADVYAVRSDFMQAHRQEVEAFVHGLLLGEQETRGLFQAKDTRKAEYKKMITAAAKMLLDSDQAIADTEGLYADGETVGFAGNVKFFTDDNWPRNFNRLTDEIQSAFIALGMLTRKLPLEQGRWDYAALKTGLKGTEGVELPRFDAAAVAKVVAQKQATGALATGALFSFEVYFKPNQNTFTAEMYAASFDEAIRKASTYSGAVITVEGHADPLGYLKKRKEGAPEVVLTQQKQAAKNLSVQRAMAVRDALIQYAAAKGISLDQSQFTVVGHGIAQPRTGMCGNDPCAPKTEQDWLSNMRVVFQLFNVEAEESVFSPLK
jgi:ABC-type nitrate/sulfonate/bicarbonate transport system substrate-binding protein/outer membrane protein OmpA-like peptidoglycan-associated protein